MSDPDNFIDDGDADDLFGDDSGAEQQTTTRQLDDSELDSGDDLDRRDREPDRDDMEMEEEESRDVRVLDSELSRHPLPQPSDDEISSFRVPNFLGIAARPYDPATFKPPTTDHNSTTRSDSFSAFATASSTIRYRNNPKTGKLESNTLLHRWSDGSVTLQVGEHHYELQHKSLVPPKGTQYQPLQDAHQYLATPQVRSQLMQLVGHMTSQYTVRPNKDIEDDALERLQSRLAAAARGRKDDVKETVMITATEDPELQKKRAEIAEKERLKAQRRRETASARAETQVRYRSSGYGAGLSIDDLEGSRSSGATRKRPAGGPRRTNRPRNDYDSEDEYAKGGTGRNEYDLEDDFVASSDEGTPPAELDDDEEEEEILEDSDRDERPRHKKHKKSRHESDDEDAEGEADEDIPRSGAAETGGGRGRRNIIEDDDDDE